MCEGICPNLKKKNYFSHFFYYHFWLIIKWLFFSLQWLFNLFFKAARFLSHLRGSVDKCVKKSALSKFFSFHWKFPKRIQVRNPKNFYWRYFTTFFLSLSPPFQKKVEDDQPHLKKTCCYIYSLKSNTYRNIRKIFKLSHLKIFCYRKCWYFKIENTSSFQS